MNKLISYFQFGLTMISAIVAFIWVYFYSLANRPGLTVGGEIFVPAVAALLTFYSFDLVVKCLGKN